jgi:hypothetical protein
MLHVFKGEVLANMTQVSDVAPGPLVNSRQFSGRQVDISGASTVLFTGTFSQILLSLQRFSLPIQLSFGKMLSDVFYTNR